MISADIYDGIILILIFEQCIEVILCHLHMVNDMSSPQNCQYLTESLALPYFFETIFFWNYCIYCVCHIH